MFAPERVDIHTATSSADISIHDAYSCRQGTSIENPGRSLTTIPKTIIATEKHPSSQSKENIEPPSLFIGKTPIHLFIMKVQETKKWSFDMHLACVQSNPPSAPYGPPWTLFHGGFKLKVLSEWSTLHCVILTGRVKWHSLASANVVL